MQLAWSRIWTRVSVSISYDNNYYTTAILGHIHVFMVLDVYLIPSFDYNFKSFM